MWKTKVKTWFKKNIYKTENGIRVYQNPLYRWLKFESEATQSLINRLNPARIELEYLKPISVFLDNKPKTCILGLGGAAFIHIFIKKVAPEQTITVVELNNNVIDIAYKYFYLKKSQYLKIINEEASKFIGDIREIYDLLFIDLFDAYSFPKNCCNLKFFSNCYARLAPNGILAVNLAGAGDHNPVFRLIRNFFKGNTIVIPIKNTANIVIIAWKAEKREKIIELLKKNKYKHVVWDQVFGCVIY